MTSTKTAATYRYVECPESAIPADVRFDVPRRHQGQIVEVAYGGFDRAEHDAGDRFKRVIDRSDNSVRYYRLEDEAMTTTAHDAKQPIDMTQPVLYRYADAAPLRNATPEELAASIAAAEHDGGAGVITVDGLPCYVQE